MSPLLSDLELGQRERIRRQSVIACRLPREIAEEVIRRARLARISKSAFVTRLVVQALAKEAKR